MIKAVLSDFDGTITRGNIDILDVVCGLVGKEAESRQLNLEFQQGLRPGRSSLIERINFLSGVTLDQIRQKLEADPYLKRGVHQWMQYLKENKITTILYSGNIEPILEYYQRLLGFDYIVGTKPKMDGNKILSIREDDFPPGNWKLIGVERILGERGIKPSETLAIGDSPADRPIFEFAGTSIAIDLKGGVEKFAMYTIEEDLSKAIKMLVKSMVEMLKVRK